MELNTRLKHTFEFNSIKIRYIIDFIKEILRFHTLKRVFIQVLSDRFFLNAWSPIASRKNKQSPFDKT
jgi:hypothetical protein